MVANMMFLKIKLLLFDIVHTIKMLKNIILNTKACISRTLGSIVKINKKKENAQYLNFVP